VTRRGLGPINSGVNEISSKDEREREESGARINRDRSSQEDRKREWVRRKEAKMILNNASPEGNETIPNNAVNQSEQEPKKGGEIPKKLTHRAEKLSKLIPVTKIMYSI